MTIMEKEIFEQASRLEDTYKQNIATILTIGKMVRQQKIDSIVFAGRGSSDNSGIYFKYVCEVFSGIPVSFAAPSVITIYDGELNLRNKLVIGVSQSGEAEDVLSIIQLANKQNALSVAITNYESSPMASAAKYHLFLNVGEEKSVAATKTFTAQMYVLALLVYAISENTFLLDELLLVPDLIRQTTKAKTVINEKTDAFVKLKDCFVLGRGFNYAIADEFALKLQETTYIKAMAFATSDFYHGPFALVNGDTYVLMLVSSDKTKADNVKMIKKLGALGAKVCAFTDDPQLPADEIVLLPRSSSFVAPFVYIVAAQLFACCLSVKKQIDPDNPRGLNKV